MVRKITLHKLVRDQFEPVAFDCLNDLPGRKFDGLRPAIDYSAGVVLENFASFADDADGRQTLYEAVRYCDESIVSKPAEMFQEKDSRDVFVSLGNKLTGLVGAVKQQAMVDDLKANSSLTGADAVDLLGFVSSGVLGVLKGQIENGTVLDNPDGIGQLFLGEGDINNVPEAQRASGYDAGQFQTTGYGVASMSEGSDGSWFFRYALPGLLVGGLVLAGLNNCGNMAGKRVVAEQESRLQTQLTEVQQEVDSARNQISTLKSEYEISSSQAAELAVKADGLGGELDVAKATIVSLEGELATAKSDAQAAGLAAEEQIAVLQGEFEAARQQATELAATSDGFSAELETAKADIVRLEAELASATSEAQAASAAAEAQIASLQAEYDAAQVQVTELSARADGLNAELEAAKASIGSLEGEIASVRSASGAVEQQMTTLQGDYETAKAQIAANAESLTAELDAANGTIASLQAEVAAANSQLEGARAQSTLLDGRMQQIAAELAAVRDLPTEATELQGLLATVSSERDSSATAVSELQAQLEMALTEKQSAIDTGERLQSELDVALATVETNRETLADFDVLKAELDAMKSGRDEAIARNVEFKTTNAELQAQLDAATQDVANQQRQLAAAAGLRTTLEQQLAETSQSLADERSGREIDINRLSANSANFQNKLSAITGLRDQALGTLSLREGEISSLGEKIVTLEGQVAVLEDANATARAEAAQLEREIAALNGELQTTNASVDDARATLAGTEESLTAANSNLQQARGEIETLVAERDQLVLKQDALTSRVQELIAEKEAVTAETVTLNEQIDGLNADLEIARASDSETQGRLSLLNDSFNGLQQQLGVVTGDRDGISVQAEQLRTEVASLTQDVARLDGELAQAKTDHAAALTAMQTERDQVQGELETVRTTLTSQVGSLEQQRDNALAKIEQANAELAALNDEKASAQAMIEDMQQQAVSMQESLQKEAATTSGLQQTVSTLEATKLSLTTARDESGAEIVRLNAEIASLEESVQKEQGTVSQLNASVAELEGIRDALTAERDAAREVIETTETRLAQSAQEILSLTQLRDGLQSNIDNTAEIAQAKVDQTLAVQSGVEQKLVAAGIDQVSVESIEDNSAVAIVLGSGDLYGVGSAVLSRDGNDLMGAVGAVIAEYPDWRIDIEGHTDSQGIGASLRQKFPTNWELSAARASAAVRYLNSKAGIDAERMSARGYGDTRPLDTNETAEGREKNRRVEIILRR